MKKKKALLFVLPVLTIILEALPYGAVLNFANPEGEPIRKTFSYFSLTPFGYANFAPFCTAVMSCFAFLLLIIYCITEKPRILTGAKNLLIVCVGLSFAPLVLGLQSFTVVAVFISVTLIAELFLVLAVKNKYFS